MEDFTANTANSLSNQGFMDSVPLGICIEQCQESCKSHLFELAINNYLMYIMFAAVIIAFVVLVQSLREPVMEGLDKALMGYAGMHFPEKLLDQMIFYLQIGAMILIIIFFVLFKLKIELLTGVG